MRVTFTQDYTNSSWFTVFDLGFGSLFIGKSNLIFALVIMGLGVRIERTPK